MRKKEEFTPESNVEYVFRFFNQKLGKSTQWNFIYDCTQANGRYAFFKRQNGGRVTLDPRRFNYIMKNNLIEKKPLNKPSKPKLITVAPECIQETSVISETWENDVLDTFSKLNTFERATLESTLSMPFNKFYSDLEKFVKTSEAMSKERFDDIFNKILKVSNVLNLKLKSLIS